MSDNAAEERAAIATQVEQLQQQPGALLPILHGIQKQLGYIPAAAIPIIASALQQTRAEIEGVISFYHHFRTAPAGRNLLQICGAEACQARGAKALQLHAQTTLGIGFHQTTPDLEYSLEPVYCLGNCACGPSIRVGDEIIGNVDPQRFDQLLDQLSTLPLELK